MTEADAPRLARVLALFGEVFNEPVSDVRAEAYFVALDDVPIADIERASAHLLKTATFFPKPGEIRSVLEAGAKDAAELAWGRVTREVRRVGSYGTPDLEPAELEAVRHLWGGWSRLCATLPAEGPELLGWHKQFLGVYTIHEKRRQVDALPEGERYRQLEAGMKQAIKHLRAVPPRT